MEIDLKEVFAAFIVESEECLDRMEAGLLQLEVQPDSVSEIDEVFRAAHTVKGNAASLGFGELASFSHEMEDLLDRMRTHHLRAESGLISVLLAAVDVMRRWIPRLQLDQENPFDDTTRRMYERLCAFDAAGAKLQSGSGSDKSNASSTSAISGVELSTIRVHTSRMDMLLNLSGEVAIAVERARQRTEMLPDAYRRDMGEAMEHLDRLLRDVHETVMRCRTVPIGATFRRHRRTVRDLAAAKGKQVRLDLSGEDVEVDVSVIEALSDPLVHMIRNAIDHGVEMPDVRAAAGKKPAGVLTLSAFHERGSIVIRVVDDGGGIRRDRLRERAFATGLQVETLTDDELLSLIFEPGFSTAEVVTETSGRGVGMDVVRQNVEKVRGRVTVASVEGQGTTFTLRLPLTLAVIPGFLVSAGGELFVIPLSDVDECMACPDWTAEQSSAGSGVMYVRGEGVPFVRLRDYFGFGGTTDGREVMVIVDDYSGRCGFVVDEILGESQAVIKPLTAMLRDLPGVTGTAVMASGSVAMVLEPAAIFRDLERSGGGLTAA